VYYTLEVLPFNLKEVAEPASALDMLHGQNTTSSLDLCVIKRVSHSAGKARPRFRF